MYSLAREGVRTGAVNLRHYIRHVLFVEDDGDALLWLLAEVRQLFGQRVDGCRGKVLVGGPLYRRQKNKPLAAAQCLLLWGIAIIKHHLPTWMASASSFTVDDVRTAHCLLVR